MCDTAEEEIRTRILRSVPAGGRAQAVEVLQGLANDETCLRHFCAAVLALLDQGKLRTEDPLGNKTPAELMSVRLQFVPSNAPPPKAVAPGLVYFPDRLLGRSTAALVYRGEDKRSGKPIAVKIFEIQGSPAPELLAWHLERFRQEPCLMARLNHPHVVEVVAWGELDDGPWYAMELLDGGTLSQRITRERRLPAEDVRACFRAVASALGAGARLGISHRDVKPGNIFTQGWKLADFGMAKVSLGAEAKGAARSITSHGARLGTPAYMAPERAAYGSGDVRSDIYSLGATMYHAATGRFLFPAGTDDAKSWAHHHINTAPPPVADRAPGLPPALCDLIMRCLAKSPADRPPTFDAVIEALS
ncbi:MAG TPA: serine/threonine-protein kinase [Planctomycetota bacterium]